jgi:hypothetical protein
MCKKTSKPKKNKIKVCNCNKEGLVQLEDNLSNGLAMDHSLFSVAP